VTETSIEKREIDSWLEGSTLEGAIQSVLVMEDRAQVTRTGSATLKSGHNTLVVWPVTPLVADRTLRCRVLADSVAGDPPRVLDLQVKRRYLVKTARPEKEREITSVIEKLVDEYLEIHDLMQAGFHQHGLIGPAITGQANQIGERLVVGPFDQKWPQEIQKLFAQRIDLEERLLAKQNKQDDRLERLARLEQERLQALQQVSEYQAGLVTEVWVPADGIYKVEWEYQVPCALWRPEYTAELEEGEQSRVKWQSTGSVWQATGEDWPNIELSFSTARPTLGAELPLLEDEELSMRPKTDQEKKTIEVTSLDQTIETTSSVPDEKRSDTPPGLDDGGEARTYKVSEKVEVPSDGRPHRIQFESWAEKTDCDLLCLPEKAEFVFLRSVQNNPSGMPLLAGPVTLIKNGGYVGRSKIAYVASQEPFSLSWGSEDGLTVLRDVTREYDQTGLRKRKHYDYKVVVYLANFSGQECSLQLTERVPVSEIKQVEIEIDQKKTTPGFKKDDQGLISWDLVLTAGAEKRVEIFFKVVMPKNVIWDG